MRKGNLLWKEKNRPRKAKDTLAERLRRRPAKPMGSPRVGSNPTGVVFGHTLYAAEEVDGPQVQIPIGFGCNSTRGKSLAPICHACRWLVCLASRPSATHLVKLKRNRALPYSRRSGLGMWKERCAQGTKMQPPMDEAIVPYGRRQCDRVVKVMD